MPPIKAASPPAVSPQLQRQARPQIKAEPAESPQPTTSQPITPSKRRRQRIDSEDDFEPESPSPMKKARTPRRLPAGWATRSSAPGTPTRAPAPAPQTPTGTAPRTPGRIPGTPSQKALKDAKRAQEKEWEEDWYALVARSRWTQDKNFRHPKGTTTIYRSNATKAFPVTLGELDTLRYQVLPNRHNRTTPIRSYKREDVRRLACRKHAMLAGLHKQGLSDEELLTQGEGLWNTLQLKRAQKHPNTTPGPGMPTPPRVRNGILPPGPNGGVHQPVLLINRYDYDDGEPWGMDSDPEDEAAEDSDHGPRVWDTNNCDYGSGNFSSD